MLIWTMSTTEQVIIQIKIINKIENGHIQDKKNLEKILTELQNVHDGRGIDVDWAFGGMEIVNKIAQILKEIENKELQEAISFPACDNILQFLKNIEKLTGYNIQQFLKNIEKLSNLRLSEICNRCNLIYRMDDFLKYLSGKGDSDIKGLKDRKERHKEEYEHHKREYEKRRERKRAGSKL